MLKKTLFVTTKNLILAAILTVITGTVFIIAGVYSISSDETSRSLISYYWFSRGEVTATSWLPLHFLIVGSAFNFLKDLIILPRLISLFFGILTVLVVLKITDEIFGRREVSFYALFILLLLPERAILSIVPLPEIIFFFFITAGSLYFFRWMKEGDHFNIIIAALMLSTANGLRYEAWIFSFSLGLYSLFYVKSIRIKLLLFLILGAFPLFWFGFNYLKYNDLVYFLKEPENYYLQAQSDTVYNRVVFNPLVQFFEQLALTLSILGIAGLYYYRKVSSIRKWVFVFFAPLILFSVFAITGKPLPAHNFWRTSAVWIVLLVPFTAYILYKIRAALAGYTFSVIILLLFFAQLINANVYYLKDVHREFCLTPSKIITGKTIINYVDQHSEKNELVLIENLWTYEHFDITLASQEPLRFVFSKPDNLVPYQPENYKDAHINYYLVKSQGMYDRLQGNNNFREVFESNGWYLFLKKSAVTKK